MEKKIVKRDEKGRFVKTEETGKTGKTVEVGKTGKAVEAGEKTKKMNLVKGGRYLLTSDSKHLFEVVIKDISEKGIRVEHCFSTGRSTENWHYREEFLENNQLVEVLYEPLIVHDVPDWVLNYFMK